MDEITQWVYVGQEGGESGTPGKLKNLQIG